jgi:hypothetical protein
MSNDAGTSSTIALLGASNLTRSISTVVETLRLQHGSPLRVVVALGHGRSYGMRSAVLGRSLCSMLDCGIWRALEGAKPRFALLTDIGNDVMYGAPPRQIVDWIEQCIKRLERLGVQRINITALPLESIRSVKRWQFSIVRSVMFPTHDIDFETAITRAFETQALIEALAQHRPEFVHLVHHDRAWYGFDPIHIRLPHRADAWTRFLWCGEEQEPEPATGSLSRWRRLRTHMPARYEILGIPRAHPQPLELENGVSIEMY